MIGKLNYPERSYRTAGPYFRVPEMSNSETSKIIEVIPSVEIIKDIHLPDVAAIHVANFQDSFISKLGVEAVRRYYEWHVIGPNEIIPWGAFIENKLVGYCFAGDFAGVMKGFMRNNWAYLAGRVLTHPSLITGWLREFRAFVRKRLKSRTGYAIGNHGLSKSSFGIHLIATNPSYQGLGIGRLLLERAEEYARDKGFTEMHLWVGRANTRAIKFYEGLDWHKEQKGELWTGKMTKVIIAWVVSFWKFPP